MTSSREKHLVELVDETGSAVGARTVDEAHRPPGLLHRAFSVLLVDPAGRVLLQQRAAPKTRFPLRWANTCCGHPAPGQSIGTAANRRLREELGIGPLPLTEIGVYLYRAEDPGTGRVESEYDHVLRGEFRHDQPLLPDPDEIADLRWVHPDELRADLDDDPGAYAPWLGGVLDRLAQSGRRDQLDRSGRLDQLDRAGPGAGGAPAGNAGGAPAGSADGAPPGSAGGAPAGSADGAPPGSAGGAPAGTADGAPASGGTGRGGGAGGPVGPVDPADPADRAGPAEDAAERSGGR